MLFNSYLFVLVFLPVVIILYFLANKGAHYNLGKIVLLTASIVFYCYDSVSAFFILLADIVINYAIVQFFFKEKYSSTIQKLTLTIGIILNLSLLIYFKYLGFFEELINSTFKTELSYKSFLLPLGISYYTFSQIAYLVDSYKDNSLKYNFLDYALFISFFPKISVGPIAFSSDFIPDFNDINRKNVDYDNIAKGIITFSIGIAKKVLIADNLSKFVTYGYNNIESLGSINALIVMLAYTMQIYFDFSGYCDMAKGICLMLNLNLIDNFLSPYKSVSIDEFWKRWHISLTRFFTKYVYIPLGGNRKGVFRKYLNMFIVFFLSGLWHGASLNFIVWGLIHGIGISLSKALKPYMERLPKVLRFLGTFIFINLSWIFFRASTLTDALAFFKQLFSFKFIPVDIRLIADATPAEMQLIQWLIFSKTNESPYISGCIITIGFLLIASFISVYCKNSTERIKSVKLDGKTILTTVILLTLSILSLSGVSEFIYTNF